MACRPRAQDKKNRVFSDMIEIEIAIDEWPQIELDGETNKSFVERVPKYATFLICVRSNSTEVSMDLNVLTFRTV